MEDPTRETIATFMIQLKQSVAPVSRIGNDVEDVKGFEDASQLSDGPAQGDNPAPSLQAAHEFGRFCHGVCTQSDIRSIIESSPPFQVTDL